MEHVHDCLMHSDKRIDSNDICFSCTSTTITTMLSGIKILVSLLLHEQVRVY